MFADPCTPRHRNQTRALYEATFRHEGVLIRAEILLRNAAGRVRLVEVKSSTSVKPVNHIDCAVQAWVLAGVGLTPDTVELGSEYLADLLAALEDPPRQADFLAASELTVRQDKATAALMEALMLRDPDRVFRVAGPPGTRLILSLNAWGCRR